MHNTLVRRAAALALALMLALGCLSCALAEDGPKKATVMVYLCGSSLEFNSQGTQTISDILASRFNAEEVNVVVMLGGAVSWATGYDPGVLTVLHIGGRRPRVVEKMPLASMGAPETLTSFLDYCYANYPAEKYDLVLWDHGGGPLSGVCQDMLFPDPLHDYGHDMLDMFELSDALAASPFADKGLDLIVFHACLMGSAEVAAVVAPYAHYMVGSEDSMYGLTYDWLAGLENDATPLETATRLVDSSFAFNGSVIERQHAQEINAMSVVDLAAVDGLIDSLDSFFANISGSLDDASFTAMSNQRRDTTAFGLGDSGNDSDFDLVDLGDMVNHYRDLDPEGAEAVDAALEAAVAYKRVSLDSCYGLTVYHPYHNTKAMPERIGIYNSLGFSENYTSYLQGFSAIMTGTPLADWTELVTSTNVSKDLHTLFKLELSADQAEHYGDSELYVLLQNEDGSYSFTFANAETLLDEQGQLTGDFNGTALYAVNGEGEALSHELEYRLSGSGRYLLPATLIKRGEGGEETTQEALIVCIADETGKQLIPGAVEVWEDSLGGYTSAYGLSFADYDEVILTSTARTETRDENGAVLPFEAWDAAATTEWRSPIDDSWSFALVNDTLDKTQLYATFQVTDSQNHTYGSEPLVVKTGAPAPDAVRVEYEDADLVLIQNLVLSPVDAGLTLSASLTNLSEQEAIISLENMVLNDAAVDASCEVVGSGENWGLLPDEMQVLYLKLDDLAGQETLTTIRFDLVVLDAATEETLGTVPVEIVLNLAIPAGE